MNFYFQVFEKENLIIQKLVGEWDIEQYDDYIEMSIKTMNLNNVTKVLTDLREAKMDKALKDIEAVIVVRKKLPIKNFTNVHLVTTPILTVIAELYKQNLQSNNQKAIEYCSTIEYAIGILQLQLTSEEIETRIKNLKNKY